MIEIPADGLVWVKCPRCPGNLRPYGGPLIGNPFVELPFEYAVTLQPQRGEQPGVVIVSMLCTGCCTPYTLRLERGGAVTLSRVRGTQQPRRG